MNSRSTGGDTGGTVPFAEVITLNSLVLGPGQTRWNVRFRIIIRWAPGDFVCVSIIIINDVMFFF